MHEAAGLISIEGSLAEPPTTEEPLASDSLANAAVDGATTTSSKSFPNKKRAKRISVGSSRGATMSEG